MSQVLECASCNCKIYDLNPAEISDHRWELLESSEAIKPTECEQLILDGKFVCWDCIELETALFKGSKVCCLCRQKTEEPVELCPLLKLDAEAAGAGFLDYFDQLIADGETVCPDCYRGYKSNVHNK